MTRLLLFALGILVGVVACKLLCKRQTVSPCPEYKVYGEDEVQELREEAIVRRMGK